MSCPSRQQISYRQRQPRTLDPRLPQQHKLNRQQPSQLIKLRKISMTSHSAAVHSRGSFVAISCSTSSKSLKSVSSCLCALCFLESSFRKRLAMFRGDESLPSCSTPSQSTDSTESDTPLSVGFRLFSFSVKTRASAIGARFPRDRCG